LNKNTLAHTTWECKYHIVFAPKFRRQIIYGNIKADVANILSKLCNRKGIEIIEAVCCKDYKHMLVRIPPSIDVSAFVGYLKGALEGAVVLNFHLFPFIKFRNRY